MPVIETPEMTEAKRRAVVLANRINEMRRGIIRDVRNLFEFVWADPRVFTELGAQGGKLFALMAALVDIANSADGSDPIVFEMPYAYTIDEATGVVTVGAKIEPPAEPEPTPE